ncbi:Di-copper centre-containing protein [Stemphylium lycopersici]|uniref:Di-copper centre-containing protein n=1 Tax=Stemphylium lycopersici TaxID=183478 RepID=A0A364N075_STELY|nr:Di-copper centre-containing protein [Stemphylium lycopersici]
MRLIEIAAVALAGSASALKITEHDKLAALGLENLRNDVEKNGYPSPGQCTLENVAVRKEWALLTTPERRNYIDAIKCLHSKPALTPAAVAPGARSRFDDFVVTHVLQTYSVHGTANFLAWHRYYIWAYEQLLRNECGYKGYLPYYNWAWWHDDPTKSPLFDGSDTSISDGGTYMPGRNYTCIPQDYNCPIKLPAGSGGGCVSGPLANWTVSIGPIQTKAKGIKPNPQEDGLGNFPTGYLGVHSAGHYTVGGDAGSDFFNSPSDPAFYFHHAMIDRTWWIWQNQQVEKRRNAIAGTITFLNSPPSRNGTLNDTLTLGPMFQDTFKNITMTNAMSSLGGPFCYIYV